MRDKERFRLKSRVEHPRRFVGSKSIFLDLSAVLIGVSQVMVIILSVNGKAVPFIWRIISNTKHQLARTHKSISAANVSIFRNMRRFWFRLLSAT